MSDAERRTVNAAIADLLQIRNGIKAGRLTLALVHECVGEVIDDLTDLHGRETTDNIEPRRRGRAAIE